MGFQIDRKTLERLLDLNDDQLRFIISKAAATTGADLSGFNISPDDIAGARRTLANATDEDLTRLSEQLVNPGNNGRNRWQGGNGNGNGAFRW